MRLCTQCWCTNSLEPVPPPRNEGSIMARATDIFDRKKPGLDHRVGHPTAFWSSPRLVVAD